ncbi:hypothetical protein EMCRGX_G030867 [Ephydatia muelleri]
MYLKHAKRLYATAANNGNYCLELVRKHDFDHYLCTLLLPKEVQSAVFAIRAFNVETAQIRELVTEKATGKMRVQFWRDSIDAIYKEPPKHPVAVTLATAVGRYKLSKLWFSRLLDSREANLSLSHYSSTRELEDYSENTFSSLLYLTLEAMGVRSVAADHACSHLGKAEGICTVLRAAAYHRTQRCVFVPMDIIMRHGASQESFIRAEETSNQSVHNAVYDFASLGHTHLLKARSLGNKLDSMVTRALLPAVLCEDFLTRLQREDFNIFEPKLSQRNPKMPLRLLWKYFSHQY